jgi:hypothetical protein
VRSLPLRRSRLLFPLPTELTRPSYTQITCLYDLDLVDPVNFDSVYLYEECMEADLHAIVGDSDFRTG